MRTQLATQRNIKSIIAIGSPIVDIVAEIDKQSLEKYGLEVGCAEFINEQNSRIYTELEAKPSVSYVPGGSLQNTVRVIRWCLNMNKETKDEFAVTMLGCLGYDVYTVKTEEILREIGVIPLMQEDQNSSTSRCAVAVFNKERCLVCDIGASDNISIEFIRENVNKITQNDALFVEGYMAAAKYDIIKVLVDRFYEDGKSIFLTGPPISLTKSNYDNIMDICRKCDIIFCSIHEAMALSGIEYDKRKFNGDDMESIKTMLETIHLKTKDEKKQKLLIVTLDEDGVLESHYDFEDKKCYVQKFMANKIDEDEIMDTNGAGDAFYGGFIAQWMMDKSIDYCCKYGNMAAGVILRNVGCTFPKDLVINFDEN